MGNSSFNDHFHAYREELDNMFMYYYIPGTSGVHQGQLHQPNPNLATAIITLNSWLHLSNVKIKHWKTALDGISCCLIKFWLFIKKIPDGVSNLCWYSHQLSFSGTMLTSTQVVLSGMYTRILEYLSILVNSIWTIHTYYNILARRGVILATWYSNTGVAFFMVWSTSKPLITWSDHQVNKPSWFWMDHMN